MENSRTKKSLRNIYFGLGYQIIILLFSFISRTVFINILGAEYLGINGLYGNILQVLSLADLGVGSAMTFSLYTPLAEGNNIKIAALMNFYKKVYNYIAIIIGIFGIGLIPFLDSLVNTTTQFSNLELYYIIFLSDTVMSYLFISRSTLIIADQKNFLIKKYSIIFEFLKFVIQLVILFFTKNYILYLLVQVIVTLLKNIFIAQRTNKMYPFIIKSKDELQKSEKKVIFDNLKSIFTYKIGGVILNNTDNIFISTMVGTIFVGFYSNYLLIINGIKGFTDILFVSITASVGNLNADSNSVYDKKNKEDIYDIINFVAFWTYGFCSICLYILLNDFISFWIGSSYILNMSTVIAIVLNFYIPGILSGTILFRDTTGLFRQTKYVFLITAAVNLILSLVLGNYFGLAGILYATIIARLATNTWFEPFMLYKYYFHKNYLKYFKKQLIYILILLFSIIVIVNISSLIQVTQFKLLILKLILCIFIPNLIIIIIFGKTKEMKYLKNKIKNIFITI